MKKEEFLHHCLEAEAGRDTFVTHPPSKEEGRVVECNVEKGHLIVQTADDHRRCWDYRECEDLSHSKSGPMV
ncbi:hypothetical protein [Desulfuromonas sp. AOP6]|uniref:hypothetical protein n=1 Tax=Desulfuromonas sp. AOP6 TaxID=1566351 RepID=UPI00127D9049|nr:hypothetical protein [Desulfuromonas sp. AOP6]BCA78253.1 hypothetical protein AOP6_0040 [Desulfuromonas sp. AOP6]